MLWGVDPDILNCMKGVKDIQRNVVSIESPFEKTFIGFDTIKHLKKCHYKFNYRVNILLYCTEPKLFWRKKNLHYICIRSKSKFSTLSFNNYIKIISDNISDIQFNCSDYKYSSNDDFEEFYSVYLGFDSFKKVLTTILTLHMNPMPEKKDLNVFEYKEGRSSINISNETKEQYLFYESL